jgi:hypothetical protein
MGTCGAVEVDGGQITASADTWVNSTSYAKGATVVYGGKKYTANQANQGQMPSYYSSVWNYEGNATKRVHCKYPLGSSARYIYFRNTQSPEDYGVNTAGPAANPPYFEESSDVGVAFQADKIYGEHSLDPVPSLVFERDFTRSFLKPVDPRTDTKPPRPNPPVIITAEIMATVYGSSDRENSTTVPWFMLAMVCSKCEDYELSGVEYDFQLLNGQEVLLSFTAQSSNKKYYTWAADVSNGRINIETLYEFLMTHSVDKVTDLSVNIRAVDGGNNATAWATKAITFSYSKFILLTGEFLSTPVLSNGYCDFEVKKAFYGNVTPTYEYRYRVRYHYDMLEYVVYDAYHDWQTPVNQSSQEFHVAESAMPKGLGAYETFLFYEIQVRAKYGTIVQLWSEAEVVG